MYVRSAAGGKRSERLLGALNIRTVRASPPTLLTAERRIVTCTPGGPSELRDRGAFGRAHGAGLHGAKGVAGNSAWVSRGRSASPCCVRSARGTGSTASHPFLAGPASLCDPPTRSFLRRPNASGGWSLECPPPRVIVAGFATKNCLDSFAAGIDSRRNPRAAIAVADVRRWEMARDGERGSASRGVLALHGGGRR